MVTSLDQLLTMITVWFRPPKYNQGGYDAVCINAPNGLVRFVQIVTSARNHALDTGYFYEFLHSLQKLMTASFQITQLEIFFVIESDSLPQFEFTRVTDQRTSHCVWLELW